MTIHESTSLVADLGEATQRAKDLLVEIRQGARLLKEGRRILMDRRFQLGTLLVAVRATFSSSGTGAAGWRKFLAEVGLRQKTAQRYLRVAKAIAARPELADRRSFQALYEELGLQAAPRSRAALLPLGTVTVPNVRNEPTTVRLPQAQSTAPTLPEMQVDGAPGLTLKEGDEDELSQRRLGRPRLSDSERRDDSYMVRCNTEETLRLRRLSGSLCLRDAEVFREGLLALEEREAKKAATFGEKKGGLRHGAAPAALARSGHVR